MKTTRKIVCFALTLMLLMGTLVFPASATGDSKMLAQAKKGVGQILAVAYQGDKSSNTPEAIALGSCFAVGKSGKDSNIFITNWHVATCDGYAVNQMRVYLLLDNWSINTKTMIPTNAVECEILYTTSDNAGVPDYAILQTMDDVTGFKALPLRESDDVASGTQVYALGYPTAIVGLNSSAGSGIDDITVTSGIIAQHMEMQLENNQTTNVLVHDAQIAEGNSGGPLVDSNGYVVGINTYGYSNLAYSMAINTSYIMKKLDTLGISYSKKGNFELDGIMLVYILLCLIIVAAVVVIIVVLRKPGNKLYLLSPDGTKTKLTSAEIWIGWDPACQIRRGHIAGVSHKHCSIRLKGGTPVLTDHSTYGTYLNAYPGGVRIPKEMPTEVAKGTSFYLSNKDERFTIC